MNAACKQVEGILAASTYETLPLSDREQLDAHLDECVVCRETLRGFESLVREVPVTRVDLEFDLLPALRQTLRTESPGHEVRRRRFAVTMASAAAVLLVALGGGYVAFFRANSMGPAVREEAHQRVSRLDRTFAQVDRLLEARFYSRAFVVLDAAVKNYPSDDRAPEAEQMAANLAFDELHWYPEAHETLRTLRDQYTNQFESTDANRVRLEMLEESYQPNGDYLALRMLDSAQVNGDFEGYEHVLSQYPGTYVASRALHEMSDALAVDGDMVGALETLAESCKNPVAVAQVKLELARTLDRRGDSPDRVRHLYEEAASSDSVTLARAAQDALRVLDGKEK